MHSHARLTASTLALAALLTTALLPETASAQTPLPIGETLQGATFDEAGTDYAVTLDGPGFLTVVVRGTREEGDLVLSVLDDEGQSLPGARSDQDLNGHMGAEQLTVQIPWAGTWTVSVAPNFGESRVEYAVGASFLATEMAAREPDPDAKPSAANVLAVGASHEDGLDPASGDDWDWFSFTAEAAGVLTVLTRPVDDFTSGDLKLEVYRSGDLREAVDMSDQDQGGDFASESITIDVSAGETVYVRVSPSFMGNGDMEYRIASSFVG